MKSKLIAGALAVMTVAGLLPTTSAYAASSVKSLSEKEGYVDEVYIGKNGKMVFKGSPKAKDDGLYYVSGSSVKELDKDDDYGDIEAFVNREFVVTEEDYKITVATGKVEEDYEDDDLERLFYKKAKNSDIYDVDSASDVKFDTLERIDNSTTWFYKFKDRYGFITEGKDYADISKYCNLQLPESDGKSIVKVKEFNKDEDGVTVKIKDISPIAKDASYIYFLCKLDVTGSTDEFKETTAVMKVSMSSKEDDDTNYVSSVTTYLVDTDDDDNDFSGADGFAARNGKLYAIHKDEDKEKIFIDILQTERLKDDNGNRLLYMTVEDTVSEDGKVYETDSYGNVWILDSGKIYGFDGKDIKQYYKCDSSCNSFKVYDSKNIIAWEEGEDNYYVVTGTTSSDKNDKDDDEDKDKDKDDDDEDKKNNSDSNSNNNNSTDGDKVTSGSTATEGTTYTQGLNKLANGSFVYSDDGKTIVKNTWKLVDNKWKYFREDGSMATGWVRDLTYNVYHLDETTGDMTTGWYKDMRSGEWYYLGTDGAMKTGWQNVGGTWYYMFNTGMMAQGWLQDKGKWYYLGNDGAMRANCYVGAYKLGADGAWIR